MNKKAQLLGLEIHYFFVGLLVGLILGAGLLVLISKGIIPLSYIKNIVCG